jgi:hypothetical protein
MIQQSQFVHSDSPHTKEKVVSVLISIKLPSLSWRLAPRCLLLCDKIWRTSFAHKGSLGWFAYLRIQSPQSEFDQHHKEIETKVFWNMFIWLSEALGKNQRS